MSGLAKLLGQRKRLRPDEESGARGEVPVKESIKVPPRSVVHYMRTQYPLPIVMEDDFPVFKYHSRMTEVKTAIHWGQRKLFVSELQLLVLFADPAKQYHIIYAGSAPGTHLKVLDALFDSRHTWELVDPGQFDRKTLGSLPNFQLRNEFFTNDVAYEMAARRLDGLPGLQSLYRFNVIDGKQILGEQKSAAEVLQQRLKDSIGDLNVARCTHDIPSMFEPVCPFPVGLQTLFQAAMSRKPTLFVSDIRTGSPMLSNFEDHVAENMKAQEAWTNIIQADFSLLKFRLPYTSCRAGTKRADWLGSGDTVEYVNGTVVLPLWTRPTSTEGRLLVKAGALPRTWSCSHYEDQCCYFNAVLREIVHFNHSLSPHPDLDNHFDSAGEVYLWERYLERYRPDKLNPPSNARREICKLVQLLSDECKGTFQSAVEKRNSIILDLSRGVTPRAFAGHCQDDHREEPEKDPEHGSTLWVGQAEQLLQAAKKERLRRIWFRNVSESQETLPLTAATVPTDLQNYPMWRCALMPQE
jgi:cap3/cap4 methyltransferase